MRLGLFVKLKYDKHYNIARWY